MDIKVDESTVIVFDLDDTLYNETQYLRSAYIEIAKHLEKKDWKALFARMLSRYRCNEDVFDYIEENYKISKRKLLSTYRDHDPNLMPFEGVRETLQEIRRLKGKIGIITDGRSKTQRKKLKALGIFQFIDKIVISEETGFEKPEEHNYKLIEEAFKTNSYCYIADNIRKDFISPNRLGWKTIGIVDNGLNVHHDGHKHFEKNKLPRDFLLSFNEINIIG